MRLLMSKLSPSCEIGSFLLIFGSDQSSTSVLLCGNYGIH